MNTEHTTVYLKPLSREEWEHLPEDVRHFLTWEEARQGEIVTITRQTFSDAETQELLDYFERGGGERLTPPKVVRQYSRNRGNKGRNALTNMNIYARE